MVEVLRISKINKTRKVASDYPHSDNLCSVSNLAWFLPRLLLILYFIRFDGLHFQARITSLHSIHLDASIAQALLPFCLVIHNVRLLGTQLRTVTHEQDS